MSLSIEPIQPQFAAKVSGVDLCSGISSGDAAAIDAGMDRYGVLVFPDQRISDEQQLVFTRNFGAIERAQGGNITKDNEYRLQDSMIDVSTWINAASRMTATTGAGCSTWETGCGIPTVLRAVPAKYSLLSARTVASAGAHRVRRHARRLRRARRGLWGADRGPGLRALSDLLTRLDGLQRATERKLSLFKPVRQRLVRTHPVTGRKSCSCRRIGTIVGWRVGSARPDPRPDPARDAARFVYAHVWKE
jgi:alpha-ketoglutarate-dependent 2,4-dichlorophenoxyacetate dioxygenase